MKDYNLAIFLLVLAALSMLPSAQARAAGPQEITDAELASFLMPEKGTGLGCRLFPDTHSYRLIRLMDRTIEVGRKYRLINSRKLSVKLKKRVKGEKASLRLASSRASKTATKRIRSKLKRAQRELRMLRKVQRACFNAAQAGDTPAVRTCFEVEQYGIKWTFDRAYRCGQFVNGDWWVKTDDATGRVKIMEMSPPFDGSHSGSQVNMSSNKQGFDARAGSFTPAENLALPYDGKGGESIIKSISRDIEAAGCRPCLQTAAVLTVLGEVPAEGGANFFRPPFFGSARPLYSVKDIELGQLPQVDPPPGVQVPSYTRIKDRFQKLQLDVNAYPGEAIRPYDNFFYSNANGSGGAYVGYGGSLALNTGDAALRFMIDDVKLGADASDRTAALVNYLQYGIDLYHVMKNGGGWHANGGHGSGRKLPMIMAAVLLGNQAMKDDILRLSKTSFQEDEYLYFSPQADNGNGKVLFGGRDGEFSYWYNLIEDGHNRTAADPYGYIDCGHVPGTSYQAGINSMIWKGPLVAMVLMPEVRQLWNNQLFIDYVDRWVTFGAWAQNDPCAPAAGVCVGGPKDGQLCNYGKEADPSSTLTGSGDFCGEGLCVGGACEADSPFPGELCSDELRPAKDLDGSTCGLKTNGNYYRCLPNPGYYGVVYGPDPAKPGECIQDVDASDGIGRFPREHGARADEGGYQSSFVNALWRTYRQVTALSE